MAETKKARVDTPAKRVTIGEGNLLKAMKVCNKSNIRFEIGIGEDEASRFGFLAPPTEYVLWFKNRHTAVLFDKALSISRAEGIIDVVENKIQYKTDVYA